MMTVQNPLKKPVRQGPIALLSLLLVSGSSGFRIESTKLSARRPPEASASQTGSEQEPVVSSPSIDTHLVHSGTMVLRARGNGHIIAAGDKPMVRITTLPESGRPVSVGDPASIRIFIMNTLVPGKVAKIGAPLLPSGRVPIEISCSTALPAGTMLEDDVDVAIEYGRIEHTTYIVWGSFMKENAEGDVFRVEPDGKHAVRVHALFGRMASELIQIKEGLNLGDKIIITDITRYASYPRVRILARLAFTNRKPRPEAVYGEGFTATRLRAIELSAQSPQCRRHPFLQDCFLIEKTVSPVPTLSEANQDLGFITANKSALRLL